MRTLEIPALERVHTGKVREMFRAGERTDGALLMVATDRISAFDVVLPDEIPQKGKVLNQLSAFWFARTSEIVANHMISTDPSDFPSSTGGYRSDLAGRSMLVRACRPLPIECVVRGYLAGSGWKEYGRAGSVCGIPLPAGLTESERLPEAIFTPSTKAEVGHDENITFDQAGQLLGSDLARRVRDLSLRLYQTASEYALARGIIICDTKFEFGLDGDELLLIDEALTPDSSRFWPADQFAPGRSQPSYDKQFIRDYLERIQWDKRPPGPALPPEVVTATTERYLEAFRKLTGQELDA